MGFLDELKRRLAQQEGQHPPLVMNDPGISGRDTRPSDVITGIPQQPTPNPTPQVPITRPRAVMDNVRTAVAQPPQQMPQVQQPVAQPVAQPMATMRNDTPEATRDRRTQPRDYVADDEAYLRDLRNKPRNWKDKVVDALDAVNAGLGGQRRILPTKRERAAMEMEDTLGRDVTVGRARQAIEQGQMVPFQLPDGTWTQIPLKQAATVGSRQQGQQAGLSLRKRQLDEHLGRWQSMTKHEAMGDAQRLYNSGAADDDPDLRDEIVRMMGLPQGTKLPPHTMGQIQTDADGNIIVVDRRKGTAAPVTMPNAQGVATPVGSMQGTVEKGRNRRFAQGQAGANERAGMRDTGRTGGRATSAPRVDGATRRKAAQLVTTIENARKDMEAADRSGDAESKALAQRKGESAATELNALGAGYEAGAGEGGYPYYKQGGAAPSSQGRTIEGAIQAFEKSQNRKPTADEIARMKAALGQ